MLTCMMVALAKSKVKMESSVVVVFIAGEEGGDVDVGVDMVVARGEIEELKNGLSRVFVCVCARARVWFDCVQQRVHVSAH